MSNANSRFFAVSCDKCGCSGNIRIDQYKRKGGTWRCRSCAFAGRKNPYKGTGVKNDPELARTRSSFYKAKHRCKTGHNGYYENVEFKFKSLWQLIEEIGIRPEGMSLDRINNSGHYEPGNVRWATQAEQCRNTRRNVMLEYNGEKMCLKDAAKAAGLSSSTLEKRIKAGCPDHLLFKKGRWRYKNGRIAESE